MASTLASLCLSQKTDILNIRCDYQFVFSVLDELLFHTMLDAADVVKTAL